MQNSELYRRGFVLPLDAEAEVALSLNDVNEGTRVEKYEFPDEGSFYSLWDTGLFSKLNNALHVLIDDYSEEVVAVEALPNLRAVISAFRKEKNSGLGNDEAITALEFLCTLGIDYKRPLYFIF